MNTEITRAVRDHLVTTFSYDGLPREVEPHMYGVVKAGEQILIAFQTGGLTRSGKVPSWRTFRVAKIRTLAVQDVSYGSTRSGYNRFDKRLAQVFARA